MAGKFLDCHKRRRRREDCRSNYSDSIEVSIIVILISPLAGFILRVLEGDTLPTGKKQVYITLSSFYFS